MSLRDLDKWDKFSLIYSIVIRGEKNSGRELKITRIIIRKRGLY